MIDHLKPVLSELRMVPIRDSLYFTGVHDAFNDDGSMKEADEQRKRLSSVLDELTSYAHALRALRSS